MLERSEILTLDFFHILHDHLQKWVARTNCQRSDQRLRAPQFGNTQACFSSIPQSLTALGPWRRTSACINNTPEANEKVRCPRIRIDCRVHKGQHCQELELRHEYDGYRSRRSPLGYTTVATVVLLVLDRLSSSILATVCRHHMSDLLLFSTNAHVK